MIDAWFESFKQFFESLTGQRRNDVSEDQQIVKNNVFRVLLVMLFEQID